jgi:hypothetical protein
MEIAKEAKEFSVRRNTLRRNAAEYNGVDIVGSVTHKRVSKLGNENKKFTEHVLKLQSTGFGLILTKLRKASFKFVERRFKLISMLVKGWQVMTGHLGS